MADAARPGQTADAEGNPAIDPTRNVLDLVKAAIARQDDLRDAQEKLWRSELNGLRDHVDTKFSGVDSQLAANENRRIESKEDNQKSLDAALSAAKEAVKEQAATSKEATSQQNQTFMAQLGGVEKGISDLRDRIGTLETRQQTKVESRDDNRLNVGMIVGITGAFVGLLLLIIATVTAIQASS